MKGIIKFFLIMVAIIMIVALLAYVGLAFLAIIILWYFISSIREFNASKKKFATEMKCPNCGCENVKIQSKRVGTSSVSHISGGGNSVGFDFLGSRNLSSFDATANSNENYKFQREGICQECGYNYDYTSQEEIDKSKKNAKYNLVTSTVLFVILIIIITTLLIGLAFNDDSDNLYDNGIWAVEYTSIDQFDYYLDGNYVYLKEYEGNNKKVKISSSYIINNKEYHVISFADGVFSSTDVYSVILPDSLTSMPSNTFNGSDVKYVYIPASLTPDGSSYSFYDYFHDVEIIYYGGSESQWKILTNNTNRADIDAKEIRYNVNSSELINQNITN